MSAGSVQDTVDRLRLWCRLTPEGLSRVEFHSEPARQQVMQALGATLPEESGPLHEISLSPAPAEIEVVHRLVDDLETLATGVVSLTGFGPLFLPWRSSADLVSVFNFNRERLAAPPLKQIWWMPSHVVEAFLHGAPDLYSWFRGRWHLTETVSQKQTECDPETVLTEFGDELRTEYYDDGWGGSKDLNNLAQLLQATNRLDEAEPLMRRALTSDEESFGGNHPNIARDLDNLAQLLQATNRLDEAEPLIRRALAIDEESFGGDHPNVAIRLNNLAQLLQTAKRLDEAEPLMRRALDILQESLGKKHPWTQTAANNLAILAHIIRL